MYVKVVPYDPNWNDKYETEAKQIKQILSEILVDIHHIGSTSVKGLAAKPIIDIMPIVKDIEAVDQYNSLFERIGYECMGELGMPGRRYFRKGGRHRTHQIHIFDVGNQYDIDRHLAVRDYLRAHKDVARAYGELKLKLAQKHPQDIEGYCDGKETFVKEMEQSALKWFRKLHLKIRRPRKDEYKQITEFFKLVITDTFNKEGIGHLKDDIDNEIRSKDQYIIDDFVTNGESRYFLIALDGSNVIGTIEYGEQNALIKNNTKASFHRLVEVGTVFVHPYYQNQGIGRLLLNEMCQTLLRKDVKEFCLDSGYKQAQKVWRKVFGKPEITLKDYWDEGSDHMIWKVDISK